MQQYIGFRLKEGAYAIPIMKVREIINLPEITTLPQASPHLRGITNLRGSVIPVVNLKRLMEIPENGSQGSRVIVLASGRVTFGVLVDEILGVISIEESTIEPPTGITRGRDQVSGVAKRDNHVVVLLETKKLIPVEDMKLLEDSPVDVRELKSGKTVEVTRTIQTMAGEVRIKELMDAQAYLGKNTAVHDDPRREILDDIVAFMAAVNEHNYEKADRVIQDIVKRGQGDLFQEVGKITRKLHDSVKSFKEAINPRLKDIANAEIPNAVDQLQYVIDRTEEAANKTMSMVEKYILRMDELADHIRKVKGPADTTNYLKEFKNALEDDLTEIITTQSFQDLTGQAIKRVITLVNDIEEELVRLITTFGVKIESSVQAKTISPQKVSQADVDDLLKEFGF